jgi:ABC-type antimicrobial peptide transport system permease subunit
MIFVVKDSLNGLNKNLIVNDSFKVSILPGAMLDNEESAKVEKRAELLNYIVNSQYVDKKGIVLSSPIEVTYEANKYYNVLSKTKKNELESDAHQNIQIYQIDKDFYDSFKVKVESGIGFNKENFLSYNDNEMPVIAGYNFKGVYKLNDKIKASENFNYRIIGFLPKNFLMYTAGNVVGTMKNMDSKLITPLVSGQYTYDRLDSVFSGNFLFTVKDTVSAGKAISDIENKIKILGLKMTVISFNQDIKNFNEDTSSILATEITKSIILVFFSISGLSFSVIANINMKKKEFGILMACGASFLNIFMIIFQELLALMIVSYSIGSILFINLSNHVYENQISNHFGFFNLGLGLLSVLFLLFVSSLIAFYNIKKLKPSELIGGFRE